MIGCDRLALLCSKIGDCSAPTFALSGVHSSGPAGGGGLQRVPSSSSLCAPATQTHYPGALFSPFCAQNGVDKTSHDLLEHLLLNLLTRVAHHLRCTCAHASCPPSRRDVWTRGRESEWRGVDLVLRHVHESVFGRGDGGAQCASRRVSSSHWPEVDSLEIATARQSCEQRRHSCWAMSNDKALADAEYRAASNVCLPCAGTLVRPSLGVPEQP
jgi:hypothetical protein